MKNIRKIIFSIISIFLLCIIAGCTSSGCTNHYDDDNNGYCDNCNYQIIKKVNCPHCNSTNDKTSKYCYSCGKEIFITKQCLNCNTELDINTIYCTKCGTNTCNHNWIEATCAAPKTCTLCNKTEGIKLEHNYESLVINPTCTEQGLTIYSCNKCKHTYIDDYVNKLEHNYQKPVFTWEGYTSAIATFICNNDSNHTKQINATITQEEQQDITCIQVGIIKYIATIELNNNIYTDSKEETIPMIDHIYEDGKCTMCGKEQRYIKDGEYIYFGTYPQSEVTDINITIELNTLSGEIPTSTNNNNWTSYGYYISGSISNYMWYQDIEYNNELYRGVYFTSYRPYLTVYSSSTDDSYQDDNGYTIGNIYWFKYEPIKWRILTEENNKALLLCETLIDSQEYCHPYEYIPDYNNYVYSNIRKWLNDNFYNTAFTTLQKEIIELTEVDNSVSTTGYTTNIYACNNTNDNIFLLSYQDVRNSNYGFNTDDSTGDQIRQKKTTAYAQCQGVYTSTDESYYGNGWWWLRSPDGYSSNHARLVDTHGYAGNIRFVHSTFSGVCPALWITLDTSHKHSWSDPTFAWEDNNYAIATFTCSYNSNHTKQINATITSEETKIATCTNTGIITHTATVSFNNKTYTDTLEETIPTDHNYVDGKCTVCNEEEPKYIRDGNYIYFGTYPQSEVTDINITTKLNTLSGTLPTSTNSNNWTSYEYYINGSISNYMWYQDIEYNNELYRGVYFTSYRPDFTTSSSSTNNSYQDDNGYTTGNIYWFKYEPIKWRILTEENGKALLLCEMLIDSQEYYHNYSNRTINGETIYANNYEYSNIRKWLNDNFYNTAFTTLQKEIIELIEVDNSVSTTGYTTNIYACNNRNDNIFLLSYQDVINSNYGFDSDYSEYDSTRQKKLTEYAVCQGANTRTNESYYGNGLWWLRSPNDNYSYYSRCVRNLVSASISYNYVNSTYSGVCPALWITLDTSHKHSWSDPTFAWENNNYAIATFTCSYNSNHTKRINATITSEVTIEPTCTATGVKTHTATVSFNNKTYTDTLEETIPTDHNYVDGKCTVCNEEAPKYIRDGDYIYFGTYPQSEVKDETTTNELTSLSGTLPTQINNQNWTSYGYYMEDTISNYMWYQDIEYNNERYRGVYFTSYRPYWTNYSSSTDKSCQDNNGYTIGNIYWFKYEPIKWRILTEENNKALLLCEMIIDSQEYYHNSNNRTINGETIYANNYEYSNIRKWLNDNFYNTAFTTLQKEIIELTEVDNSVSTTGYTTNEYVCNNTNDNIFLLSYQDVINSNYGFDSDYSEYDSTRQKKTTAYAQCQGASISTNASYYGNGYWWLRSPYDDSSFDARYVFSYGRAYNNCSVCSTNHGVCPALWITL